MSIEQLKRAHGTMKELTEKGAKTKSAKFLLSAIDKLRDAISDAKTKGASNKYIIDLERQGKDAILSDLVQYQANERMAVAKQMEALAIAYTKNTEKDYALQDFRLKNWERRLYSMAPDEIETLAQEYIMNPTKKYSPEELDSLSASVKDYSDEETFDALRATMHERQYDKPYMQSEEGQLLSNQMKLLQPVSHGILLDAGDGRTFGASFDELVELAKPDQDEEGNDAI
jgi:hypothetical protein